VPAPVEAARGLRRRPPAPSEDWNNPEAYNEASV
jgi:hypothetical protein